MTDYANAAPPQGALFDNAPAYFREPPDTLTCAVKIARDRSGQWYAWDVVMQYGEPLRRELALKRVQIGRTVFVQPGDAAAVLDAARGTDGDTQAV